MRSGLIWAAAAVGIVAGSVGVFALRQPEAYPPGLIVANFRNDSGISARSNAVAGFGDLVKTELATKQHLRLINDRTGAAKQTMPVPDRVREAAGGRYRLSGSATFETARLHVTARLTDVRDGRDLVQPL